MVLVAVMGRVAAGAGQAEARCSLLPQGREPKEGPVRL